MGKLRSRERRRVDCTHTLRDWEARTWSQMLCLIAAPCFSVGWKEGYWLGGDRNE
jgi:hypothetical protein